MVNSEMNFSTAIEKGYAMSFLATRMMANLEDMISSEFLSGSSPQTYRHYIKMAKFLLQRPNILNFIEVMNGEEVSSRTVKISLLDESTLFSS